MDEELFITKELKASKNKVEEKPHYLGHRQRLRDKLLNKGVEALADYELLELLLAISIPRTDVKPLAKRLLNKFQNFAGVIHASTKELTSVIGVKETTAAVIKTVEAAISKTLHEELQETPVMSSWNKLIDYCIATTSHEKTEQFRILFLDTKNKLIKDELQEKGTINQASVYPREVVKRVLDLGAAGIVMLHNHPSGDPMPSDTDKEITKQVQNVLKTIEVPVHDHIIVGKGGTYTSFKMLGLIK